MQRFVGFLLCYTVCAAVPVALQISSENAPAGGFAQIKIYAVKPGAISRGHLVLNLDPTVFGPGAMVGVFGANADAIGLAATTGSQIDVRFSSATGGIGQLAGLPVLVVSVPVLASAAGKTVTVSATSPDSSVTVASGSVTVQGTLSIQKIYAGMGVVAAGTVVPVYGTGFTSSTVVAIDGVVIASTKFVSAGEIDVTLGGAAELVGKRARVTDGGSEFDYFCFQPNGSSYVPATTGFGNAAANLQPMFPLFAGTGGALYSESVGGLIAIENPNANAATVSFANVSVGSVSASENQPTMTITGGSWTIFQGIPRTVFQMTSDLPVRAVGLIVCGLGASYTFCPEALGPSDPSSAGATPLLLTPTSLQFAWQAGSSTLPAAQTVSVNSGNLKDASVTSGASWLSVSVSSGLNSLAVSVNPSQLVPGTYQGSITATQFYGPSATLPVTLTVTSAPVPVISVTTQNLSFTAPAFNSPPYTQTIAVTSDSGPAPFTITAAPGTGGFINNVTWLKISPMSGTTPATLTVTWDPAITSQIYYQQRSTGGSIVIRGPGNTVTVPATFNVTGVQTFQTFLGLSGMGPAGLIFSAQTGTGSQTQTIYVDPAGAISALGDQPWISVVSPTSGEGANQSVLVTANPSGLTAGVYKGTVTISEPGIAPISVPVTFGVWSTPPQLTTTTSSYLFVQTVGEAAVPYQSAEVDSGGVPVNLTFDIGASWLNVVDHYNAPTPAPILVGVINAPQAPGQYDGSFTIHSPGRSVYVPVTLLVEPGPVTPPVVSQVVNSASGIAGGVSPGEILTIRGYSVGASAISGIKLDQTGSVVPQSNGVRVTFDGKAAPLTYTSANQTNLVVPYEVAGQASTVMQVTYAAASGTYQTASWVLPVAAAAPGVFTIDATGTGQGAIVNQDGTVNSAANPAMKGSVISIYATGEGQTSPAGVTGSVTQTDLKKPVLPVTVTIGGMDAAVQYAGSAPAAIAGLLQVNAVVPQTATAGVLPVVVSVGGISSQANVTVAVR